MQLYSLFHSFLQHLLCRRTIEVGDESYFIRKTIGEGGFSHVDLVSNGTDSHACKLMVCESSYAKERAHKEIETLSSLRHLNIVELIDYESTVHKARIGERIEYRLLFPYYPHGDLCNFLKNNNLLHAYEFNLTFLQTVIGGLASALDYMLHQHKLSHRDIKPDNCLLGDEFCPILTDFGSITENHIELTTENVSRWRDFVEENCSMAYRAPELFSLVSGSEITEQADAWSLGCVLYAVCFLKGPFDDVASRGDSVALAVSSSITLPLACRQYKVPDMVTALITKLFSLDPRERPTFQQILSTLS